MGIFTSSSATISMTSATTAPSTFDSAGYGALSFTEIGSIESIGPFGDEASEVTFDALDDARTKKLKGQRNSGNTEIVIGLDDTDTGQALVYTAEADDSVGDFHFKVTLPNKQASGGDDAIRYFSAKVMSAREDIGGPNNVARLRTTLGINTAIVRVNSTAS